MAHVRDLWETRVDGQRVRTARHGNGKRWLARYLDPDGREHTNAFDRKLDAERFLATMEADKLRGAYLDPAAGRVTLRDYALDWLDGQTFDDSTRQAVELRLRVHVYPLLGDRELAAIRPSHVQAWLRALQQRLAPRYVRVIFANLSTVLRAAVDDERIAKNPCQAKSVTVPRAEQRKVHPWTAEQVAAVHDALPERYRVVATLAAGLGLRQGEAFGLAVDDIDFLRRVVHVRRQVKILGSRLVFAPPKGGKLRDVPLPESVALELSAHLRAYPPIVVSLPWCRPTGELTDVQPVLISRERGALNRPYVNSKLWKPALMAAGLAPTRENGMHALRHWFASVLLEAGVSVKALSEYLGHADPGFTLRTYTHLMPASDDKARTAVDRALSSAADGTTTEQDADQHVER